VSVLLGRREREQRLLEAEAALDARAEELVAREAGLDERAEALAARERDAAERERALDERAQELEAASVGKAQELHGLAGELEARRIGLDAERAEVDRRRAELDGVERGLAVERAELVARVDAERAVLAAGAAELELTRRTLAEREGELEAERLGLVAARRVVEDDRRRWRDLMSLPQGSGSDPPSEPADLRATQAKWTLARLEELVELRAAEHPERAQEWRTYLFYLRPFASANGYLPRAFEAMVHEVFGDLVGRARQL
jgi:hypothetical protein